MKTTIFKFLTMAALALSIGFASCSNGDDVTDGGQSVLKGERTSMQLVIQSPKVPQTYASEDPNATSSEIELKSVKVLIYENTATEYILEQAPISLTISDFDEVAGQDRYKLKEASKILTTTGAKKIFVAMNFSGTLPIAVGSPIADVAMLVHTLAAKDDLSQDGLAMFSTQATDAVLVAEDRS